MRTTAVPILLAMLTISSLPVLAFTKIEPMPYSLYDRDGSTMFWNESYRITVDDMELTFVMGPARSTYAGTATTVNWDPEIISILVEGDDVMRRVAFFGGVENDPISRMPFLGIGGLAPSQNLLLGAEPHDVPPADFAWIEEGEDGMVSWSTSYRYSGGDSITWLNRTFILNASLGVECSYWVTSEYQAIQQRITVTNGDLEQLLPFPAEAAFTMGSRFRDRGILLPEMVLEQDNYYTYPATELPDGWKNNITGEYEMPNAMWQEGELPGMLYVEFDLDEEVNWFGVATQSSSSYEVLTGVGVKVLSTEGMTGLRPYCTFLSGPGEHVIFGFKPYDETGAYDDFVPMRLGAGQKASIDILWFFPEPVDGEMSTSILDDFGRSAVGVPEFNSIYAQARQLFESANDLAGEGDVEGAIEKARESVAAMKTLGELSSALEEEARTINETMNTWKTAGTDVDPHPEDEGRPAMIASILIIVVVIIGLAAYIFIVEPRRSGPE
ncbi:MAG: hypothetical protein HXS50_04990 [Theionarchaea archaeon]|nr:hypothetical protein [Theionarchaea archaeon]